MAENNLNYLAQVVTELPMHHHDQQQQQHHHQQPSSPLPHLRSNHNHNEAHHPLVARKVKSLQAQSWS